MFTVSGLFGTKLTSGQWTKEKGDCWVPWYIHRRTARKWRWMFISYLYRRREQVRRSLRRLLPTGNGDVGGMRRRPLFPAPQKQTTAHPRILNQPPVYRRRRLRNWRFCIINLSINTTIICQRLLILLVTALPLISGSVICTYACHSTFRRHF